MQNRNLRRARRSVTIICVAFTLFAAGQPLRGSAMQNTLVYLYQSGVAVQAPPNDCYQDPIVIDSATNTIVGSVPNATDGYIYNNSGERIGFIAPSLAASREAR